MLRASKAIRKNKKDIDELKVQLEDTKRQLTKALAEKSGGATELSVKDAKELADLKLRDEQMRVVMTFLGTVVNVSVGAAGATEASASTAGGNVPAAHGVMTGCIAMIENVFNWPDDMKRSIYEAMSSQHPFSEALSKLEAKPKPAPAVPP
jgi:hypothetical protein